MAQIFDPLPSDGQSQVLCCYINATAKIQIARITNVPDWYFERVVFPGQRLLFETVPKALLEIHTGMMASAVLSDSIPCDRLMIEREESIEEVQNQTRYLREAYQEELATLGEEVEDLEAKVVGR